MRVNNTKNTIRVIGYTNRKGKKSGYKCVILDGGDTITISKDTLIMLAKNNYVENAKVVQDEQGVYKLEIKTE